MNAITEMITQKIAGSAVRSMAGRLGLSEAMTEKAVQMAVPLLVGALARNAAQPAGADALQQAVTKDHDGSVFDNLLGTISDPQSANAGGILGHVLGGQQGAAQETLANAAGMDSGSAGNLLEMLAPMVMGSLGQTQRQQNLDAGGLSDYLNTQEQQAQTTSPDLMRMLSGMFASSSAAAAPANAQAQAAGTGDSGLMGSITNALDSNHDGSVTDDVEQLLGKFLKQSALRNGPGFIPAGAPSVDKQRDAFDGQNSPK